MDALRTQVVDHALWIRKCRGIPGIVAISVHVVDTYVFPNSGMRRYNGW
jgi:hypothetical protein